MNEKISGFFNLSFYISKSGFKLRNEGSYFGVLWYILNPILFFLLLFVVFSRNLGEGIENYALYLFMGIIMFNFFQSATTDSTEIIRSNKYLFKSINFPRSAFIAGNVLKFLYAHLFEFVVLIIFVAILKEKAYNLVLYPLILFFFFLFTFGTSLLLGAISVFFIDTKNLWGFASKFLWFSTPIFYTLEKGTLLFVINLFNPLYYFIDISRDLIIYNTIPRIEMILGGIGFSFLFLFLGTIIFNKLNYKFTERI